MNEYEVRQTEIQNLIQERQNAGQQKQEWNYRQLTASLATAPRFKYQNVAMSHHLDFQDDVRNIIYDERTNPEDAQLLISWGLTPFEEKPIKKPELIPPKQQIIKRKINESQLDKFYGPFEMEGVIHAKINQFKYNEYHFNLRSHTLIFYPEGEKLEKCDSQLFHIALNQRTYDFLSFSEEYLLLRGEDKNIRIKNDELSRDLLKHLEKKLLMLTAKGAFSLRNQTLPWQIEDFVNGIIDRLGPIHFEKQNHVKQIVKAKYYKETLGAFFALLKRFSKHRKLQMGQIYLPRWLKNEIKQLPDFSIGLMSNLIPLKQTLQNLKIKIEPHQVQGLTVALKYIFPFFKNYLKRTFIVYESELTDEDINYFLKQISYPMHTIGFPNNLLSIHGLCDCIESASSLYQEVIDYSYNQKLSSIGQDKLFNLLNNNPSIKKLVLKGCYVRQGQEQDFFEALTNNLCLQELELDFLDHYGNSCVQHLRNYAAHIY